ncbi:MAG: thymidylate kinase [Oscillospiraceae bacterium]|nr:thymidylate kinase [Oscillospiraceae bacterium]
MGKLFVLEGTDGSGKTTQWELLRDRLNAENAFGGVKPLTYPDYDKPSSTLVKMYLGGDFGSDANAVNPYAASSFYAVDRCASWLLDWKEDYLAGQAFLAARYTTSNIIHQMPKLPQNEWDGFIEWLYDYEYTRLGLPAPDKVILLDMPTEVSQKLLLRRYGGDNSRKDIHERDRNYIEHCYNAALYAAEKLGWERIPCAVCGSDEPRTIEDIAADVYAAIKR